jgi:hypothetical protein
MICSQMFSESVEIDMDESKDLGRIKVSVQVVSVTTDQGLLMVV